MTAIRTGYRNGDDFYPTGDVIDTDALDTHLDAKGLSPAALSATYAGAFPDSQAITYNGDGSVATVTENGVLTSYTYNGDGTFATDTRLGVTRAYTYTAGNLTGIEAV